MGVPGRPPGAAFGLDERTVASWQQRAGAHCQRVHTHLVQAGQVDLQHVQADEIYVKISTPPRAQGPEDMAQNASAALGPPAEGQGRVWQAMAMAVPARLWLGGVISARRDKQLTWRASPAHPRLRTQHDALGLCGRLEQLCGGDHPCLQ